MVIKLTPMDLRPPSARSDLAFGESGIDPVGDVQSNYLNALMGGVLAGQKRMEALQKRREALRQQASNALGSGAGNASGPVGGQYTNAAGSFGDPINDPNFAKNYLTSVRLPNGKSVLIHKNIASNFSNFMNALWNQGYKFADVQTYNKRKVNTPKGTNPNLWSRHSTGLAVDIDPTRNPWGGKMALPKNIGQLAQQYGLSWLGGKNGDNMHVGYTGAQWKGIAPN